MEKVQNNFVENNSPRTVKTLKHEKQVMEDSLEKKRKRVEKPSSGRRGDVVGEERRRGRRRRGGARL